MPLEIKLLFETLCFSLGLLFLAALIHARYDMWRLKKRDEKEKGKV